MQQSNIPARIVTPWATNAGPYVTIIPETTATEGRASWSLGFPAINFVDKSLGGIPPDGTDMNGALQPLSAWSRWTAAGGPVPFDATYSTAVGGYPKNSLLTALTVNGGTAVNGFWRSLVENNTVNPDAALHANWQFIGFGTSYNGNPNGHVAGVAFATTGITQSLCWDSLNKLLWVCIVSGNAATAQWQAAGIGGNTGVTPGTYTYSTVTVDALGRVINAANGAIATTVANGICRPDGSTITIDGLGRLTAAAGGAGTVTNVATGAFLTGGPINVSGTVSGIGATAAQIQAATPGVIVAPDQLFAAQVPLTLSDNTNVIWNMNQGLNAVVVRALPTATIAAPTNARLGASYSLQIVANSGTTTSFDPCFDFGFLTTPQIGSFAGKADMIFMQCYSTSPLRFACSYILGLTV